MVGHDHEVLMNADDVFLYGNRLEQDGGDIVCKGKLSKGLLDISDEYGDDIDDGLAVSRMVSDSSAKGVVRAVEQDAGAAEKVASEEMKIGDLKWHSQSLEVGSNDLDDVKMPFMRKVSDYKDSEKFDYVIDAFVKLDKMRQDFHSLRDVMREQFEKASKEIELAKACNSIKKNGSSSDLIGSSSKKLIESLLHVEMLLKCLNTTIDTVFYEVNDILLSSVTAICSQHDHDLFGELGDLVMRSALTSLFDEKIWKQDAQFCENYRAIWLDKLNEVSSLSNQLDAIIKSIAVGETELVPHKLCDLGHLHHDGSSNKDSCTSLVEDVKSASTNVPECYDYQHLNHMPKEELVSYFNTILSTMRRDHESALQQKTEEYFLLKREYLKERGSAMSMAHRRSDEFDGVRKKIPEVVSKLEELLLKNKNCPSDFENEEKLKARFDYLLQENHCLEDRIADMKRELKCLESQVSIEITRKHENGDFVDDFAITQGLSKLIFLEALRDAALKLDDLHQKFREEKHRGMLFESRSRELENELRMEVEEKKRLVEEKDKLLMDLSILKSKEREQLQELDSLRDRVSQLEKLFRVRHREIESLNAQLAEALKQIDVDKIEVHKLNQKLDQAKEVLEESNREREAALSCALEKHDSLLLSRAREEELKKEMEKISEGVRDLSTVFDDFETRVLGAVEKNHLSLGNTTSHLKALTSTANLFRRSGQMYKQRLKRNCADLQMAETEVDLLGDEVDTLLNLLEKIYVALDHYSPILKHYPGIVEILELFRRELLGEKRLASWIGRKRGL